MGFELFDKQRVHIKLRLTIPSINVSRYGRIVFSKDCTAALGDYFQINFNTETDTVRFIKCTESTAHAFKVRRTNNKRGDQGYINGNSFRQFFRIYPRTYPATIGPNFVEVVVERAGEEREP